MSIRNRLLLFLVPTMLLLFGLLIFFSFRESGETLISRIGQEAFNLASSYAQEFNVLTESLKKTAEGMAIAVSTVPEVNDKFIKSLIKNNLKNDPNICGSTVAFKPGATGFGLYSPYFCTRDGKDGKKTIKYESLAKPSYDYVKWKWFTVPLEAGKSSWGEPYYDEGGGQCLMITYSALIKRNGKVIGVATVDVSLGDLVNKLKKLKVGETGNAFIVTDEGYTIGLPGSDIISKETIQQLLKRSNDPDLKKLIDLIKAKQQGNVQMQDPFTSEPTQLWVTTMPIRSTGWMLVIIYPRDEILRPLTNLRNVVLAISLVIIALLILMITWISSTATAPISKLVEQTERFAAGQFEKRLDEKEGTREIQKLSRAFNVMGQAIDEKIQELSETQLEIVYRLGRAAEYRDTDTGLHLMRMSHYSALLAKAYGMSEEDCDLLLHASPMHDIGKIGIPDSILLKKGKLTDEEWTIMKTHPAIGNEILSGSKSRLLQLAQLVAYNHHEKWDGTGYPRGLKGSQIPVTGRIVAIADVFDSLTSERPYKKAWTVEEAMKEIELQSGRGFQPELVDLFKSILPEIVKIKDRFAEAELISAEAQFRNEQ